jgi:hypothetical protein
MNFYKGSILQQRKQVVQSLKEKKKKQNLSNITQQMKNVDRMIRILLPKTSDSLKDLEMNSSIITEM